MVSLLRITDVTAVFALETQTKL